MYDQQELLEVLLARDEYCLVVLQTCRWDAFTALLTDDDTIEVATGELPGDPLHAKSFGTHPYVWLARGFTDWYPATTVYSCHPAVNSAGKMLDQFLPDAPPALYADVAHHDWRATDHFPRENIHHCWAYQDDPAFYYTPHDRVLNAVLDEGFADRMVVFLRDPMFEPSPGDSLTEADYHDRLRAVLDTAATLAAGGSGETVITAMHGASFRSPSEYRVDWLDRDRVQFTPGLTARELTEVPWFVVDAEPDVA